MNNNSEKNKFEILHEWDGSSSTGQSRHHLDHEYLHILKMLFDDNIKEIKGYNNYEG